MTFKDKHFKQAFGPLLLSALMLVPTGCRDKSKDDFNDKQQIGLLDPKPLNTEDRYGTGVMLYHVTIPVYNSKGEAKPNQGVLTRGLQSSSYIPDTSRTFVRKAFVNNSNSPVYVKIDRNNAVFTDRGFCGLFWDGSSVVVVDDSNIAKFIGDKTVPFSASYSAKKVEHSPAATKNSEVIDSVEISDLDAIFLPHAADSLDTDSSSFKTDTVMNRKNTDLITDTISQKRQADYE